MFKARVLKILIGQTIRGVGCSRYLSHLNAQYRQLCGDEILGCGDFPRTVSARKPSQVVKVTKSICRSILFWAVRYSVRMSVI